MHIAKDYFNATRDCEINPWFGNLLREQRWLRVAFHSCQFLSAFVRVSIKVR